MKRNLFICRCSSAEHMLLVSADEEDLFIEVPLCPLPWPRRLVHALKYLFGRRSLYGDFEEILLSPESALDLGDRLLAWSSDDSNHFSPNDVY